MKRFRSVLLISFFALTMIFPPFPGFGENEEKGPGGKKAAQKREMDRDRAKTGEETGEVKKGVREVGRELKETFKGFPAQAGKELRKTKEALKETGKELKKGTKEAVRDLKKFFKD